MMQSERKILEERIKKSKAETVSYHIDTFNSLIFPNRLIKIFCTSPNDRNKKPTEINPNANGRICLKKNRRYFAIGTTHIIHFKDYLPFNYMPWEKETNN